MEKIDLKGNDNQKELITRLQRLLEQHKDKRVVVVGTTCAGKSTFLKTIEGAHDMDELVFPQLTPAEHDYVCQSPWTPEIGETMIKLVKERVKVESGQPVFGTVVLDSDLIIYLHISDERLRERTQSRGATFEDAKNMQEQIEQEIETSGIPTVRFLVG